MLCENIARANAPIDTGNLRMAISTKQVNDNTIITELNATRAIYGIHLDNGTKHIKQHEGFFTENIFTAQVDVINNYLSGNIDPVGDNMQKGLYTYDSPAVNDRYLKSMAQFKED